ncbi:MAG: glycosyltransferase family 39 protein [Planctomycetes bacterium]|nr:glycosyltransferase family 39 protein [Planctomycetota bacterium]
MEMPDSVNSQPCSYGKALLLLCLALFLVKLWDGVLLEDPARYASISKCILTTGDAITMHETPERLYFNKPPLYFWLTALLFKACGTSVWAARFWSALAGIGSVMLLYALTRRYLDARTGLLAGMVLALSNDFLRYSIAGRLDAPQVFFILLAIWGYACVTAGKSRWAAVVPGLACGLGILTKGPLVLLALPIILSAVLLRSDQQKNIFKLKLFWLGIILGLAISAPWHILVARANPDFWDLYWGREMLARMQGELVTGKGRLNYLLVLFSHYLPWTPLALYGIWLAGIRVYRQKKDTLQIENPKKDFKTFGVIFFFLLIISAVVAFAPPRMYGRYLMFLYPPLSAFTALALVKLLPEKIMRHLENRLWLWAILIGLAIFFLPVERHQSNDNTNLLEAAPVIRETVPEDKSVVIFYTEIHAPEAVIYFYTDRESVRVKTVEKLLALAPTVVVTSKGGMEILEKHGYTAAIRSPKLTLAKRK